MRAGALRSAAYRVEALDRPRIEGIDLAYVYPAFSGLKPRAETDTGDIYAPAGSTVTVKVRTSKPLKAAELRATDGEGARALPLQIVGERQGEVAFTVARDGAYRIALTDTDAIDNGEDTEYFVRVMDDRLRTCASFVRPAIAAPHGSRKSRWRRVPRTTTACSHSNLSMPSAVVPRRWCRSAATANRPR